MAKTMLIFMVFFLFGCVANTPFTKLSEELSVKQFVWKSGRYYRVDTILKNTSAGLLTIRISCILNKNFESVKKISIIAGQEVRIAEKIFPFYNQVSVRCKYFKIAQ